MYIRAKRNRKTWRTNWIISVICETITHEHVHLWLYNKINDKTSSKFDNIADKIERWW